jgi:hypothetical protein
VAQLKWFHGAVMGSTQKAVRVVAHSMAEAHRMVKSLIFRAPTYNEMKTHWNSTQPQNDSAPGVYVAADMNYPREYKLRLGPWLKGN